MNKGLRYFKKSMIFAACLVMLGTVNVFAGEMEDIEVVPEIIADGMADEVASEEDVASDVQCEAPYMDETAEPGADISVEDVAGIEENIYSDVHIGDDTQPIVFTNEGGELIEGDADDPEMFKHLGIHGEDVNADESSYDSIDSNASGYAAAGYTTTSPFTGRSYSHDARFEEYAALNGIDVSKWQGTINWSKVKKAGVDYAFIRIGYRGYGDAGNIHSGGDDKGAKNVRNAYQAGIKVGVYFYSQAISEKEAKEEAQFCINFIRNNGLAGCISMPVFIDYEYAAVGVGRLYNAHLSAEQHQAICDRFASTIKSAGFTPGIYASYSMLVDDMRPSFSSDSTKYWLARWNSSAGYGGDYSYWQYADDGSVDGISGNVDCNFIYKKVAPVTYKLSKPTKTTYKTGEKLDLSGGYIKGSNGKKIKLKKSMLEGGALPEFDKEGIQTIGVAYNNSSYSFDILVQDFDISIDATYGDTLGTYTDELPASDIGSFKWKKGKKTKISAVGKKKYTVIFTPDEKKFSARNYTAYLNVRANIGDEYENPAKDIKLSYNKKITKNNKKASKVFKSLKLKNTALKKNKDFTLSLVADEAVDESGAAVPAGTSFDDIKIPKGYSGTFTLIISAEADSLYDGTIKKTIKVTGK